MARRQPNTSTRPEGRPEGGPESRSAAGPQGHGDGEQGVLARALRVLLIAPEEPGAALAQRLEGRVARLTRVSPVNVGGHAGGNVAAMDTNGVLAAVSSRRHDIVLIHADAGASGGFEVARALSRLGDAPASVMIAERPTMELALSAMRAGSCDMLCTSTPARELADRLADAARQGRMRSLMRRRLERRCARLQVVSKDVDATRAALDRELANLGVRSGAHEATHERVKRLTMATEIASIFRQELELESLLRTALECLLKKTGPTNAAIFLPSSAGDFTLGAYANYDCPKGGAETMLDTLAGVVAPAFERRPGMHHLPTPAHVELLLGEHAHWLPNSAMVVTACRANDECLAVLALFRDSRDTFGAEVRSKVGLVAELFTQQLARVVRTHHRHLPKDKWASPGDVGLEADDEFEDGPEGFPFNPFKDFKDLKDTQDLKDMQDRQPEKPEDPRDDDIDMAA
jgi:FixJ family two-component response regulator